MKLFSISFIVLALAYQAKAFSPDFISNYIQHAKVAYADNGYRVVHEKTFSAYELNQGQNTLACQLDPGEYFVQLITEPCLKVNLAVQVDAENEQGILSEKPEMRTAIAIFDVPQADGSAIQPTEIILSGSGMQACFPAKARVLVYQRIGY